MNKFIFVFIILILNIVEAKADEDYFNKALNLFNKNNYLEAKYYFEKSIAFNPKDEKSYLYLAKISKINKDQVGEDNFLNTVLFLNPKNEEALYSRILLNINEADFKKAQDQILVFSKICKKLCSKQSDLSKLIIVDNKK
jgi:tetratricopeptide (TPR) repeat protein